MSIQKKYFSAHRTQCEITVKLIDVNDEAPEDFEILKDDIKVEQIKFLESLQPVGDILFS